MEKVTLFFCDICGTFDCGLFLKINYEELNRFISNLKLIMKYNETDKIIFSFVTTENIESVMLMDKALMSYIDGNIYIGKHFYQNENKVVNKAHDIFEYIQQLKGKYIIDSNIYYADDCELYHYLLKELNNGFQSQYVIHSIIPKKNGLVEVNDFLENHINKISINKIYIK